MKRKIRFVSVIASALVFVATSLGVEAASIRVTCEKRGDRSKISVDGRGLAAANYRAQVMSVSGLTVHRKSSPLKRTVGGEVEYDFDSNSNDIAEGATPIGKNFIISTVTGKILNRAGRTVLSDTVACRRR